jgi:RNA polymerase sigma-70 factor (ECF subfamily)
MERDDSRTSIGLLQRLADLGDSQAWQTLWQRYIPRIRTWAQQGGLSTGDAEEVTSMVLERLVRAMPAFEYNPQLRFRGWLRTVVRHAVCDFRRARARHPAGQGTGGSDVLALLGAIEDSDSAESLVEELNGQLEQQRSLLQQAIERVRNRVEPRTWEAFSLRVVEQWDGAEVARRLSMKVAAVYVAQNRVSKLLREELAELGLTGP